MIDRKLWIIYSTQYENTDKRIFHYLSVPDAIEITRKYRMPQFKLTDEEALEAFLVQHDGLLVHPVVTQISLEQEDSIVGIATYRASRKHQAVLILTDSAQAVTYLIASILRRFGENFAQFQEPSRITIPGSPGSITIWVSGGDYDLRLSERAYDTILFDIKREENGTGSNIGTTTGITERRTVTALP